MSDALIRKPYQNKDFESQVNFEKDPQKDPEKELDAIPTENLSADEVTFKKRHGDLRRHSQKKEEEYKARIKDLETQLKATPQWTPSKTDEELEAFQAEHPDSVEMIKSLSYEANKGIREKLQSAEEKALATEAKLRRTDARNYVLARHSDYNEIIDSDEFHVWAGSKSDKMQDMIYDESNVDGSFTSDVISQFKLENGISNTPKVSTADMKKAASKIVGGGSNTDVAAGSTEKIWKASEIAKMSLDEYEKNEEVILKARDEGRIDPTK